MHNRSLIFLVCCRGGKKTWSALHYKGTVSEGKNHIMAACAITILSPLQGISLQYVGWIGSQQGKKIAHRNKSRLYHDGCGELIREWRLFRWL